MFKGAYNISPTDAKNNNMDLIVSTGTSLSYLDSLKALGLKAIVWVGDCYKQSDGTLGWNVSDTQLKTIVGGLKGHPAVHSYQLCDEPNNNRGNDAGVKVKARTALVKSVDPGASTFITIGGYGPWGNFASWADVIGIDPYPARWGTFKLSDMTDAIARLKSDVNRPKRVIGIYQTFSDNPPYAYYPMPSAAQTKQQIDAFVGSGLVEGVAAYMWSKMHDYDTKWASMYSDVMAQIKSSYAALGGSPTPAPTPAPTPTPVPAPAPSPSPSGPAVNLLTYGTNPDVKIGLLTTGCILDRHQLPVAWTVVAQPASAVGSVRFTHDGMIRIENTAPYAYAGDVNGDLTDAKLPNGEHTITAQAFSGVNATGTSGPIKTVSFEVRH